MKIKAMITGVTGMVGEGVLHECLLSSEVESVLVVNRRPCHIQHPKLKEIIHENFFDFTSMEEQLKGYDACFFCLGISSVGMKEEKYQSITYDLTLNFAKILARHNPDMTFCYVSGAGTDSTEKGRIMWARVKGKTENHLMQLFPQKAFMFRPGFIQPTRGLKNTYTIYKIFSPLFPVLKFLIPKQITSLKEIGLAMIKASQNGYDKKILDIADINTLAKI